MHYSLVGITVVVFGHWDTVMRRFGLEGYPQMDDSAEALYVHHFVVLVHDNYVVDDQTVLETENDRSLVSLSTLEFGLLHH
jgi:hypothetical protein